MGLDPLITNLKQKVCSSASLPDVCPETAIHALQHCAWSCRLKRRSFVYSKMTSMNAVQIRKVDQEILTAVRQQSSSGSRARCVQTLPFSFTIL